MSNSTDRRRWYQKKRWIIASLVLFPPLGIPLLWFTQCSRSFKIAGTVVSGLILLGAIANEPQETQFAELTSSPQMENFTTPATVTTSLVESASPTVPLTTANHFGLPKATCGDEPTGIDDTWYPVFVDGGELEAIREQYCADAITTARKDTGVKTVQLASFTSRERALEFAEVVNGDVGEPSVPTSAAVASAGGSSPDPQIEPSPAQSNECDPAYPDICIPPGTADLDCGDIPYKRFTVLPPDPHGFDGRDNDGIGCES